MTNLPRSGDTDALLHDALTELIADVGRILASDWLDVLIHYSSIKLVQLRQAPCHIDQRLSTSGSAQP
jgi:hypothetical protein